MGLSVCRNDEDLFISVIQTTQCTEDKENKPTNEITAGKKMCNSASHHISSTTILNLL